MKYFIMQQDQRFNNAPVIEEFNGRIGRRKDFCAESCHKIKKINVVYSQSSKRLDFLDVLDSQAFLISKGLKKVFDMYNSRLQYKLICILNNVFNEYGEYYAPILPIVDCATKETLNLMSRNQLDRASILQNIIDDQIIFKIKHQYLEIVVVRLDAAESILRRKFKGIQLREVEVL